MSEQLRESLPPLAPAIAATEPAFVRQGGRAVKESWQQGEVFEGMLLEELSGELAQTSGLLGGEEAEGPPSGGAGEGAQEAEPGVGAQAGVSAGGVTGGGSAMIAESYLPHVLSEALQRAGGLGLAASLAHRAQEANVPTPAPGDAHAGGAAAPGAAASARSEASGGASPS